ncbi:cystathionine gamma-lyase [Monosporozyma servazzii]
MTNLSTQLIHADDKNNRVSDVAPPITVSTTFRYDNDNLEVVDESECIDDMDVNPVYSRCGHPNSTRVESVMSEILGGYAVVYNTGVSSFYAAMVHYNPKRLFIGESYHGVHAIADIMTRNYGLKQYSLNDIEEFAQEGDLVHIESPVNPYGTSINIQEYVDRAHAKGAKVTIDATFAPPPLQDSWDFGVDMVMYSATKYFGGHSDLLAGILVSKEHDVSNKLKIDRMYLGTIIGNLESFLLLRSLRTYEMRIMKQSENATKIVSFLQEHLREFSGVLKEVIHSSLQTEPWVKTQAKGGHTPVFCITLQSVEQAKHFPSKLKLFHHATSLGGIESLIEWRALSDPEMDQTLLRVSVGCENADDLINDLKQGLMASELKH